MIQPTAILIAGPTGSGKSALALALAEALGGLIVNADSMQVYRDLRIITARPTPEDESRVAHRLYGHVDAAESYSAGRWLADIAPVLEEARQRRQLPIIVGGTGLYFKVLTRGLAAMPPIPEEVRAGVRARLAAEGAPALHAALMARDPDSAQRLRPSDRSRVARALEIVEATGRSIRDWQREGMPALVDPARALTVFLTPDKDELYRRIEARFDAMLEEGALEEVEALAARALDPLLPVMKAHGVPWLVRHLAGDISREEAALQAKRDTRHYAKRQLTWFRHQLPEFAWIAPQTAAAHIRARLGR